MNQLYLKRRKLFGLAMKTLKTNIGLKNFFQIYNKSSGLLGLKNMFYRLNTLFPAQLGKIFRH